MSYDDDSDTDWYDDTGSNLWYEYDAGSSRAGDFSSEESDFEHDYRFPPKALDAYMDPPNVFDEDGDSDVPTYEEPPPFPM
jgi:hypothetical protein